MKVLNLKNIINSLSVAWLLSATGIALSQDDINEPAGDIAEAQDDSEMGEPVDTEAGMMMEETGESEMPDTYGGSGPASQGPASESADAEAEESQEPIGPVWESYNDNLKSVAQEVTKGLRVEDVVEPPTEYHYAAFGKPDPFLPPLAAMKEEAIASISGLEVPIVSPLQRYDVRELRLVGIWQLSSGERKALIIAPASEGSAEAGIIVRNGDSIGKKGGKLLAIGDTFLTVREFRLATDGTRQYEDIQMLMGNRDANSVPGKIKFVPGEADTEIILEGQTTPQPGVGLGAGNQAIRGRTTPRQEAIPSAPGVGSIAPAPVAAAPAPVAAAPANGVAPQAPVAPAAGATAAPAAPAAPPITDPTLTGVAPTPGQQLPGGNTAVAPVAGGGIQPPSPPTTPAAPAVPGN